MRDHEAIEGARLLEGAVLQQVRPEGPRARAGDAVTTTTYLNVYRCAGCGAYRNGMYSALARCGVGVIRKPEPFEPLVGVEPWEN